MPLLIYRVWDNVRMNGLKPGNDFKYTEGNYFQYLDWSNTGIEHFCGEGNLDFEERCFDGSECESFHYSHPLCACANITVLNISHNYIPTLPYLFIQNTVPELITLDLSHNRLTQMPPEMTNWFLVEDSPRLHKIKYFDISYNLVSNIPVEWSMFEEVVPILSNGLRLLSNNQK